MNFVLSCYLDELNGFYFYNFLKVKVTQPVLDRTILLVVSSKWISITLVWIGRSSISFRLVNSFIGPRVFIIFYLLYFRILFLYTAGNAVPSSHKTKIAFPFPLIPGTMWYNMFWIWKFLLQMLTWHLSLKGGIFISQSRRWAATWWRNAWRFSQMMPKLS